MFVINNSTMAIGFINCQIPSNIEPFYADLYTVKFVKIGVLTSYEDTSFYYEALKCFSLI